MELDAVVTGVEAFGIFVQGLGLPAEGLVPLDELPDDTYRYDRASHSLSGRRPGQSFRLGDRVRVVVARVDLDRRELNFRLVGRGRAEGGGRRQQTAARRGRRDTGRSASRRPSGRGKAGRKRKR
jgi:ribonuclease R